MFIMTRLESMTICWKIAIQLVHLAIWCLSMEDMIMRRWVRDSVLSICVKLFGSLFNSIQKLCKSRQIILHLAKSLVFSMSIPAFRQATRCFFMEGEQTQMMRSIYISIYWTLVTWKIFSLLNISSIVSLKWEMIKPWSKLHSTPQIHEENIYLFGGTESDSSRHLSIYNTSKKRA